MQEVTGEIGAVTADVHPFRDGAGINPAAHGEVGGLAVDVPAAGADGLFQRQAQFPGDQVAHGLIFIGQIQIAGKTWQTARSREKDIVHVMLLSVSEKR
jgi:hypothetical protein